ncbi:PQQ-binding-like beta-propeller repeat protein [Natrarchaeobius sp. A-rgal3]|uniref:outer membrane protein assembly factor BamB family protein n=1 Tax=Natrarchaeobius versutus TaxID=1679078 RepID=UPI00350F55EC
MTKTNRRRFLGIVAASTVTLGGGCLDPAASEPGEHPVDEPVGAWPSFRGDRFNTGFAKGVSPIGSNPSIEWTVETDGPVWGSPAVVDGTVYIGSADHSVYAVDAETGDTRWTFPTEHRVEGTPAYGDETVYVGSYDKHLYAIEAETGDRRWEREFAGLVRGSPTLHEDAVVVGVGCHNLACSWYAEEAEVSEDGWVYSLDAATGETNWRYDVGDEVVGAPAIRGDTVYIGGSDGVLYALEVGSGDVVWTYETHSMIWSSPAVAFGTVYFGDWTGEIHAVDATDGETEWTANTHGDYVSGSVAVDEEAVYVGHTPYNPADDPTTNYGEVFRLDRTNGETEWRFETSALEIGSSPVVTDDRLYIGTHRQSEDDGVGVHALSTEGEEEWFLEVGGRGVGSSPALVDGSLYFGGTDGRIYAVG